MINISQVFLGSARNMSEDEQIFTEVELKTLENLITETKVSLIGGGGIYVYIYFECL